MTGNPGKTAQSHNRQTIESAGRLQGKSIWTTVSDLNFRQRICDRILILGVPCNHSIREGVEKAIDDYFIREQ